MNVLNYLIGAIRRRIVRDIRKQLDVWAFKCVALQTENPKRFIYDEIRPFALSKGAGRLPAFPWRGDCSAFVILLFWLAGGCDPSGNDFNGDGNTGSFNARGRHITLDEAIEGDVIVYGDGYGVHAVMIVQRGPDPLVAGHRDPNVASDGAPGNPVILRNSALLFLGPPNYLRFSTKNRRLVKNR